MQNPRIPLMIPVQAAIISVLILSCASSQEPSSGPPAEETATTTTAVQAPDLSSAVGVYVCKVAKERNKKVLAIFTFTGPEDSETSESRTETTKVMSQLGTCKLRMIDKSKLKKVLDEQAMGQTGLVDSETAPELGKLVGADALLFGTVDKKTIQVRLVDSSTGEVLGASVKAKPAGTGGTGTSGGTATKGAPGGPGYSVEKFDPARAKRDFNRAQVLRWLRRVYRRRPLVFIYATANEREMAWLQSNFPRAVEMLQERVERGPAKRRQKLQEIKGKILKMRTEDPRVDKRTRMLQKKALHRMRRMKHGRKGFKRPKRWRKRKRRW